MKLRVLAPGKVNLCLFLGGPRADGRHELVTLLESVSLADELQLSVLAAGDQADEVVCPGVEGPNIVSRALEGLRAAGWTAPPVQVVIHKRIPVAAGMGGGSADAAATLRMAQCLAPLAEPVVAELAAELGTDVPSQLTPGLVLGTGAGDQVGLRPPLGAHAFVIVPTPHQLSTADVYLEADRLGLPRGGHDLNQRLDDLASELSVGARLPERLFVNDLEPAALSICPQISLALHAAREAGAEPTFVCGSGPTVAGVYWGPDGIDRAAAAAAALAERFPGSTSAVPVLGKFGFPLFA